MLIGCFAVKSPEIIKNFRRQGWFIAIFTLIVILIATDSMPGIGNLYLLLIDIVFLPAVALNYRLWKKGLTVDAWKDEINSIGRNEEEELPTLD